MRKRLDLIGQLFGRLHVLNYAGAKGRKSLWRCRCACGSECAVVGTDLVGKRVRSCGCLHAEKAAANGRRSLKDLTGRRFGHRTVLSRIGQKWLCRCDCGEESAVRGIDLKASPRCLKCGRGVRHGHNRIQKRTPTYSTWSAMLTRCQNPKSSRYADYGGRGITVYERWQSFENFLADMRERPARKTIDRIDNDRGYEPENCRWATALEQRHNRRPAR